MDGKTACKLLTEAAAIVQDRSQRHGDITESFDFIADMWTAYLSNTMSHRTAKEGNTYVTAGDVARMLTYVKHARSIFGDAENRENYLDAAGYEALAGVLDGGGLFGFGQGDEEEKERGSDAEESGNGQETVRK